MLQARGITQRFPGVLALDCVDLCLRAGEVHALMGQNGAGKSTLVRALTGAGSPDAGTIELDGRNFRPRSPAHARQLGISTVYQEVNLCPNLSVAENIIAGRYPRRGLLRGGGIDWPLLKRQARAALAALHVDIDVGSPLAQHSVALQQMVAIARAIHVTPRVLVLDEPTSSLDAGEVSQLFAVLRRLRDQGLAILFITHFLEQVYELSDRITVLRNGRLVGEYPVARLDRGALIRAMIGEDASPGETQRPNGTVQAGGAAGGRTPRADAVPLLSVRGLASRGRLHPLDLDLRRGEVLGVAGLLGSGRTELARLVSGLDQPDAGEIVMAGAARRFAQPADAIAMGVAYCPEERKSDGILADLSLCENVVLALQARTGLWPRLAAGKQADLARRFVAALGIRAASVQTTAGKLSGGNQQKVILARWLAIQPALLILDEPTRGIDVAAKAELMNELVRLAGSGMTIVFISAEIDEVVRVADRILVLCDRRKAGELPAGSDARDVYRMIAEQT